MYIYVMQFAERWFNFPLVANVSIGAGVLSTRPRPCNCSWPLRAATGHVVDHDELRRSPFIDFLAISSILAIPIVTTMEIFGALQHNHRPLAGLNEARPIGV